MALFNYTALDNDSTLKEGVIEAMKSFTNVKTYSLPWP